MVSLVAVEWVHEWMSCCREKPMVLDRLLTCCEPFGNSILYLGLSFPILYVTGVRWALESTSMYAYKLLCFQIKKRHLSLWRLLDKMVGDYTSGSLRSAAPRFVVINPKFSDLVPFPIPETRQDGKRLGCFLVINYCIWVKRHFLLGCVCEWVYTLYGP